MSHRSSTSQEPSGPSKRQKVYRACHRCVSAKTRCEDVLPRSGCLKCRTKDKPCSLIQDDLVNHTSELARDHVVDEPIASRLSAIEDCFGSLHQRIDRLEQSQYLLPAPQVSLPTNHITTPNPAITSRPVGVHEIFTTPHWHAIPITERAFSVTSDLGYPDPVLRGLLSREDMDLSFHLFKYRFSSLLPLAPYLSSSTSTPSHPFVKLAVLAHAASPPGLWPLIEESVTLVHSGAVGPDIPLALLILSLAPGPADASRASMTALRTIALAYSVGQMMGWDLMAEVWCRSPMTAAECSSRMEMVLLWEHIKNRYNILCLMQGMSSDLARSFSDRLPELATERYLQSIERIRHDAQLVAVFAPVLAKLCLAEAVAMTDLPDIQSILEDWQPLTTRFDHWQSGCRGASKLHLHDGRALLFSIAFRLSCVVQRVPSPIALELRIPGQSFTGINLLRLGRLQLESFNAITDGDLAILPVYLHFQTVTSISVQQRAISHMRRVGADWHQELVPIVDMAVNRMKEQIRGLPGKMLDMVDEQRQDRTLADIDIEALFGSLPADWMNQFDVHDIWGLDGVGAGSL